MEKIKELEGQLRLTEQKFDDKADDYERLKRDLNKVRGQLTFDGPKSARKTSQTTNSHFSGWVLRIGAS